MVNKREVEVGGRTIVVTEDEDAVDPSTGEAMAGSWLWDCSLVLSHWLDTLPSSFFEAKRFAELGAGTGLPGLTAAACGASSVLLTDLPALLPGLLRNVAQNGLQSRVQVCPLTWGQDLSHISSDYDQSAPFDFILASDLLYDIATTPQLCRTLAALSGDKTQILLAYELRPGTTECFRILRDAGFQWIKVPQEELHPDWQSEDIGIFRVTKVA